MENMNKLEWDIFDSVMKNNLDVEKETSSMCCKHKNVRVVNYNNVCIDCGVVVSECNFEESTFNEIVEVKHSSVQASRISEWYKYSNKEKCEYNLKKRVIEMCGIMKITQEVAENISLDVIHIIGEIKKRDGIRRSRSKDSIIAVCICNNIQSLNIKSFMETFNLTTRQITKAERSISELHILNNNMLYHKTVLDFVSDIAYNLSISDEYLKKILKIADICDKYDLIIKHSPQTIAIACTKTIVDIHNDEFTDLYNISSATIHKACQELSNEISQLNATI